MSHAVVDIFRQAAELNRGDSRRRGNVVMLDGPGEVIVAGDLHGHRPHLARIIRHADLHHRDDRCLVLQELIHAPPDARTGEDRSIELLMRAARLRAAHPSQVLFVLGNHDVAQVSGREILKNGRRLCDAFRTGIATAFGPDAREVLAAAEDFLLSAPLAVRCPNRVFIAHSVPSPRRMASAGMEILHRPYRPDDLLRGGCLYEWTWGRDHTPDQLADLAGELDVDFFVLGHAHAAGGMELIGRHAVTITSDQAGGQILHFSTKEPLTADNVQGAARPLAAVSGDET